MVLDPQVCTSASESSQAGKDISEGNKMSNPKPKQEPRKKGKKKASKDAVILGATTVESISGEEPTSASPDNYSSDNERGKKFSIASIEDDMYEVSGAATQTPQLNSPNFSGLCGTEEQVLNFRVFVTDPSVRSGTTGPLTKYIVYLVRGYSELCGEFSSRKRYSDFQWLRENLVLTMPGSFVPPLPRKQKLGRFEEEFVEARRASLEEFLARLLNRKSICSSNLFRSWLMQSEQTVDELKKEFSVCKTIDVLNEYKVIYADAVKELGSFARSHVTKFIWFRQFLHKHLTILQEMRMGMSRMASLHCSQTAILSESPDYFKEFSRNEKEFLGKVSVDMPIEAKRVDLSLCLESESTSQQKEPSHGYDVLVQILAREIQDTESILDASSAIDRLIHMKHQTHHQIDKEEASMRSIQKSSRGGFVASWFQRKDKETQINEIRINVEKLRMEIINLDELIDLARLVLVTIEQPRFMTSKITAYNRVVGHFLRLQASIAKQASAEWSHHVLREDADGSCVVHE